MPHFPYEYITIVGFLLSIIYLFVRSRKSAIQFLFIWNYLIGIILINSYSSFNHTNVVINNFHAPVTALFAIYYIGGKNKRTWTLLLGGIVLFLISLSLIDVHKTFNNWGYLFLMFLGVFQSIFLFKKWLDDPSYEDMRHSSKFWFSLGFLLFFVSSFPILANFNELVTSGKGDRLYSNLIQIGNILLQLGYLLALCLDLKLIRVNHKGKNS